MLLPLLKPFLSGKPGSPGGPPQLIASELLGYTATQLYIVCSALLRDVARDPSIGEGSLALRAAIANVVLS